MTVGMMRLSISLCLLAAGLNAAGVRLLRQDVQLTQPLAVGATIAVGDFNGDGRPDLAAGMAGGIAVMLNRGRAAFGPAIYTGIPQPAPVAIADFNLDGKVDVAAYGQIALGRGDGTFLSPQATSPAWFAAEAGDFNGDGLPDLAAVQTGACGNGDAGCSALVILLGNGDATFRSADRFQIAGGYKPVVVDFNRDGKADLAVNLGNAVAIFLGNGDGSFRSLKAASLPAGAYTTRLLAADLNGDGIPDLVSRSHVLLGLGDGTFRSPAPYNLAVPGQTSPFESSFALADLDGDGHIDLATVENFQDQPLTNKVRIFRGRGDGTFESPEERTVGWGPQSGAAADFDGDGRPDLVVPNWRSNSISLLSTKIGAEGELRAVSAADGTAVVAAGSLASFYVALGAPAQSAPIPSPTTLGDVSVRIDDGQTRRLAPLLYVSDKQINFQVPPETAASMSADALIEVMRGGAIVQTGSMHVASVAPTLFMADPSWAMPAAIETVVDQHGSPTSFSVFDCTAAGVCNFRPVSSSDGGSYLTFYGTGFRGAKKENVQCRISGRLLEIEYAGPQGMPGLDQINVRLPDPSDSLWEGAYFEIYLSIDGTQANMAAVTLTRYY